MARSLRLVKHFLDLNPAGPISNSPVDGVSLLIAKDGGAYVGIHGMLCCVADYASQPEGGPESDSSLACASGRIFSHLVAVRASKFLEQEASMIRRCHPGWRLFNGC